MLINAYTRTNIHTVIYFANAVAQHAANAASDRDSVWTWGSGTIIGARPHPASPSSSNQICIQAGPLHT